MLEWIDTLGRVSMETVWLPLLAWTVLWLLGEAIARLPLRVHPLVRYRATQALLFALPLGFALAPFLDAGRLAPWWVERSVVTVSEVTVAGIPVPAGEVARLTEVAPPVWTLELALGLLLLVAVAFALVRLAALVGQARDLRALRRGLPDGEPLAAEDAKAHGVSRRVRIAETDAAPVPMTFGVLRPVIVMPASLRGAERDLARSHELVHVRHHDALAAWLEAVVAAVFAFHPGVHRLVSRCDLLREMACDAALLSHPAVSKPAYASLIASFAAPPAAPTFAVGMADRPSHVHQRLLAMTTPLPLLRRTTALLGWVLAGAVLLGASLTVTASRALAQEKRVEVRTVEATTPPTIFVDGERFGDDPEALNSLDVYSVEVLQGDDAQQRYGVDHALEILTREGAEARGLPAKEGTVTARFVKLEDGDDLARLQIDVEEESDGADVVVRRLRDGGDGEVEEVIEQIIGGDFAPGTRVIRLRSDGASSIDFESLGISPDQVQTIDIEQINGAGTATIRLRDGEVRVIELSGDPEFIELDELTDAPQQKAAPARLADVRVDPNPARDEVAVRFSLASPGEVTLAVYDIEGRRLIEDVIGTSGGAETFRLDVSDFAPGTYIYRLQTPGAEATSGRFTVTR